MRDAGSTMWNTPTRTGEKSYPGGTNLLQQFIKFLEVLAMDLLRVLIIDSDSFQQGLLSEMLRYLGISNIMLARDSEHATQLITSADQVDIVFGNLNEQGMRLLEFLHRARRAAWARSVVVMIDYPADLKRSVASLEVLATVELLGVLSSPLQVNAVEALLDRFLQRCRAKLPVLAKQPFKLPSEIDVCRAFSAGEFKSWYQPKFNMLNGNLVGIEALVRWYHPVRGLLLPKDFLTAVLAYDLIDEMFKVMLGKGVSLLKKLRDWGVDVELGFNMHTSQMSRRELVTYIQKTLADERLPGAALLFEFTENGLLQLPLDTQVNLMRLRMLGCALAIDNFGLGFSSFELLSRIPFTQLKLEGKFVDSFLNSHQCAIIASAQALARTLNMNLVVEGIGSQAARDELLEMGCVFGQGYYLAPPMSEDQFLGWVYKTQLVAEEKDL